MPAISTLLRALCARPQDLDLHRDVVRTTSLVGGTFDSSFPQCVVGIRGPIVIFPPLARIGRFALPAGARIAWDERRLRGTNTSVHGIVPLNCDPGVMAVSGVSAEPVVYIATMLAGAKQAQLSQELQGLPRPITTI
jgi:hypothetical protein